jgi:hypothetical protein
MEYYYFVEDKYIMKMNSPINLGEFPQCVEMTPEQLVFYKEHPTSSVNEIKNCKLYEPYILTVEDNKKQSIDNLSHYSLSITEELVPSYKIQNALICTNLNNHDEGIYSHDECLQIIEKYNRIGKYCRENFYIFKEQIENCETNEEINNIFDQAIKLYDTYRLNNIE